MTRRVLVVDDDESIRGFLRVVLELEGFEVLMAVDGADALARLAASVPDCVVLDVMMPGVGGLEVLRRVRASELAGLPVVLCTAYAEELGSLRALGADHVVRKPFHPDELVRALDRLVPTAA